MTWENYGPADTEKRTWQVDHIIPKSLLLFDSITFRTKSATIHNVKVNKKRFWVKLNDINGKLDFHV